MKRKSGETSASLVDTRTSASIQSTFGKERRGIVGMDGAKLVGVSRFRILSGHRSVKNCSSGKETEFAPCGHYISAVSPIK